MKTFQDQGKVGLCGVYSAYNAKDPQGRFNDLGLSSLYVKLGEKIIAYDVGFFKHVAFKENTQPTGTASCKRTGVDWKPEYATLKPEAVLGKKSFIIRD